MPTPTISGAATPFGAHTTGLHAPAAPDRWTPPTVELICLACEISAYAPDGDLPLL
jgi:hypothetical protein